MAVMTTAAQVAPRAAADGSTQTVAWGFGLGGQLGNGGAQHWSVPVAVSEAPRRFGTVSAGQDHTLAINEDGSVWAWGGNNYGEVGDGTFTRRSVPVRVPGLANVVKVAGGEYFSLAVRSDGTVWAWGRNNIGQLGIGSVGADQPLPRQVPGLTGVIDIAAGATHALAAGSDGRLWAWGGNYEGQVGDGTGTDRVVPVPVTGAGNVIDIAAGAYHSLAIRAGGQVLAWGDNYFGSVGDGTRDKRLAPVPAHLPPGLLAVAAGGRISMALHPDGRIRAWGDNGYGQLGLPLSSGFGEVTPRTVAGISGVTQIAAGLNSSYAIRRNGQAYAWGLNQFGELGDGSTVNRHQPTAISGPNKILQISAGGSRAAAVRSSVPVPPQGFEITIDSEAGTLEPGGSLEIMVFTTALNDSMQQVTLHAVGLPAGVTASFSPATILSGESTTLTLTADPQASARYPATVTIGAGKPGALNPKVTFDLMIGEGGASS